MRSTFHATIQYGMVFACTLAAICGCDQSAPQQSSATQTSTNASTDSGANQADIAATAHAAPSIDEGAVNADGLVVLAATDRDAKRVAGEEYSPKEGVLANAAERNQSIAADWPKPQAVIFVSGQQHGYIEPCGCTGLDRQKGGLIRRDTLLTQLRERGWDVVPVDVGNQVRRIGPQPVIKFASTVKAFKTMGYGAATLGVDDLKLSSVELLQSAGSDELNPGEFISANVSIIDPSFFPSHRIVEAGGRKIGITGILGSEFEDEIQSSDVEIFDPVEKLTPVVAQLKSEGCDFLVLLAHASLAESASIARQVPGFDLVVTAGGFGEPTLHPEKIEGAQAVMVQVGTKGMYGGIVGIYDQQPIRYQKIAITSQFKDSQRMLEQFADYQERLQSTGLESLGVTEVPHPTGRKFVGSETCGDCHSTAYEIWENSPHFDATEHIVAANNDRGGIPRHHDPECISCHATGWNPQNFYPYESGYLSQDLSEHLLGSGCENCHGPGKDHVDAEYGDVDVDNEKLLELRKQMVLTLEQAQQTKCIECHDLDNSPDFHPVEDNFDRFWEQIKHYGKD